MSDFAKGLYVNAPRDNAPGFVKGSISLKPTDLCQWLRENQELINEKGYINFDVLEKKDGSGWYAKINDFKPQAQAPAPQSAPPADFSDDPSDIPF